MERVRHLTGSAVSVVWCAWGLAEWAIVTGWDVANDLRVAVMEEISGVE
jgi:hypothetical protein